jgi:hypothetical protein
VIRTIILATSAACSVLGWVVSDPSKGHALIVIGGIGCAIGIGIWMYELGLKSGKYSDKSPMNDENSSRYKFFHLYNELVPKLRVVDLEKVKSCRDVHFSFIRNVQRYNTKELMDLTYDIVMMCIPEYLNTQVPATCSEQEQKDHYKVILRYMVYANIMLDDHITDMKEIKRDIIEMEELRDAVRNQDKNTTTHYTLMWGDFLEDYCEKNRGTTLSSYFERLRIFSVDYLPVIIGCFQRWMASSVSEEPRSMTSDEIAGIINGVMWKMIKSDTGYTSDGLSITLCRDYSRYNKLLYADRSVLRQNYAITLDEMVTDHATVLFDRGYLDRSQFCLLMKAYRKQVRPTMLADIYRKFDRYIDTEYLRMIAWAALETAYNPSIPSVYWPLLQSVLRKSYGGGALDIEGYHRECPAFFNRYVPEHGVRCMELRMLSEPPTDLESIAIDLYEEYRSGQN